MPELVMVSSVDNIEKLRTNLRELFKKGRYSEITTSIGMYAVLMDPNRMLNDQRQLYGLVLNMIKDSLSGGKARNYASWLAAFPKILAEIVSSGKIVVDRAAADVVADYHNAYGPFSSVDDFYFWALTDRKLSLGQIVRYIEKTVELHNR